MELNYNWTLKGANFSKDKGKVFSCFACGGGSTMGYKLAGFDVVGANEIDPKMMAVYTQNHQPKYTFLEGIQSLKLREDLPSELYNLDILDGSPPCSSFSTAGNREADWGKKKKFREGQQKQILDTLFFDFIELGAKLRPKVIIAENVKGLLLGAAKAYVIQIYKAFNNAGYYCQHWLLNAAKFGVPQARERVFFIALRKDLASQFLQRVDMFTEAPLLNLDFDFKPVKFAEIEEPDTLTGWAPIPPSVLEMWHRCKAGEEMKRTSGANAIGHYKAHPSKVLRTIVANENGAGGYHYKHPRRLTQTEIIKASTFPLDYNFGPNSAQYVCGMSVPPLMIARISLEVHKQWLSKL